MKMECMGCGKPTPVPLLDAKPAGKSYTVEELSDAAARGEPFKYLACSECYGPGYNV